MCLGRGASGHLVGSSPEGGGGISHYSDSVDDSHSNDTGVEESNGRTTLTSSHKCKMHTVDAVHHMLLLFAFAKLS